MPHFYTSFYNVRDYIKSFYTTILTIKFLEKLLKKSLIRINNIFEKCSINIAIHGAKKKTVFIYYAAVFFFIFSKPGY